MPVISPERLANLQSNAQDIRNICILAHVDHGKTSLTDALIATNGIISPKMAGKIRYLDSRPDEQLRGITMESSAISLSFSMARKSSTDAAPEQKDYLINLIDSPGHVDFSSEVSTASRLCDGALVLVDAVEGVQSQTVTVLRQTWMERLKPLLVINKIDRLIWELKMSAAEANTHLNRLVEEVNAVIGSFFQGERMEEDLHWRERIEARVAAAAAKEQERKRRDSTSESIASSDLQSADSETAGVFEEKDDEALYFAPENNNIIFSSAVDGWAFTVRQFATLYEKKLGIKRSILEKVLWGDYYLDPKTKRILTSKHLKGRSLKPMFVQLVLDNIWAVYESTTGGNKERGDPVMLEKITKSLNLKIAPHIMRSRDPRALLTTVFAAWLPVSTAVLVSVVEHLPSPPVAQADRVSGIIESSPGGMDVSADIKNAMTNFETSKTAPVVAYVSKMVSVPVSELPQNKRKAGASLSPEEARELARKKRAEISKARAATEQESSESPGMNGLSEALGQSSLNGDDYSAEHSGRSPDEEPEQLIGFARIYSGTISVGDSLYVLPPKFSPSFPHSPPEPRRVTVTALYLLMGRSLESLDSVPAGCVFGVGGLEGHILKNGTLCSHLEGAVNLAGVNMGGEPIVRVALEPTDPRDLGKMIAGMKLLEQSDPCARYEVLESGEHVIATAGELHLERCLNDLRERFARCEIQPGEPIVPYRESIVEAAEMSPPKNKDLPRGTVVSSTASGQVTIRLRVRPMPAALTDFLDKHAGTIRKFYTEQKAAEASGGKDLKQAAAVDAAAEVEDLSSQQLDLSTFKQMTLEEFRHAFAEALAEEDKREADFWKGCLDRAVAFGPRRCGPNLLVDDTPDALCEKFLSSNEQHHQAEPESRPGTTTTTTGTITTSSKPNTMNAADFADRISHAFQLATAQGPLCHEPLSGVAVSLESVTIAAAPPPNDSSSPAAAPAAAPDMGRLTGEVLRLVRSNIHAGFLDFSPRLQLAVYQCEIQASAEVLGRVYGVVTRRRGRILAEALNEGTPFFTVTALLPVAESFGFGDEMRKRTSGGASPQLRFAGFDMLDEDPLWVPFTEDELEDLGELADRENVAKRYMDRVRKRKGLLVRGGRAQGGEKARTLKK